MVVEVSHVPKVFELKTKKPASILFIYLFIFPLALSVYFLLHSLAFWIISEEFLCSVCFHYSCVVKECLNIFPVAIAWFIAMGILLCASLLVIFFFYFFSLLFFPLIPILLCHLTVSALGSRFTKILSLLKMLNSWYCKVKVSKTWFDQKCFSSHSVACLCVSDSEIIAKNVFAKRRHLFVPFLTFNLLRFSHSYF